MSEDVHHRVMNGFAEVVRTHEWDRFGDYWHPECVLEFPQSGERFRGIDNVLAQFANYPSMEPGTSELQEVISEPTAYALSPSYTVIGVEGTGNRGTAVIRVRYPDGSMWYAINLYEVRDNLIHHCRAFFAPDFEPPDWRAAHRESP